MSDRRYNTGLWLGRIVAVTPPLILLIWIGFYLVSLKNAFLKALPQIVASAAGLSLNREIHLGGVSEAHSFNHITFTDVAISDAPTFALGHGRSAGSAQRVDLYLDAAKLLHDPSNAASYVTLITAYKPYAYIERRPGNRFNFMNLFTSKVNPKAKPFTAQIVVHDGDVMFRDLAAPASVQPAVNRLAHVDGNVDFRAVRTIAFAVAAQGTKARFSDAQISGSLVSEATAKPGVNRVSGYTIRIVAKQADASYWTHYFLTSLNNSLGEVTAGRGDVDLTLSQRYPAPGVPLDISGEAQVRGGQFILHNRNIVRAPIDNANGVVDFTGNSVAVNAAVTVAGMPVNVTGNVPTFKNTLLDFRFTAPSVDAARLHEALPFVPQIPSWIGVTSRPSVVATAKGPVTKTRFDVAFTAPSATVYGTPLHSIRGGITYEGRTLTVSSLIGSTTGRADNVAVTGVVDTTPRGGALLTGHAAGVDLASVNLPGAIRQKLGGISGIADADVRFASGQPVGTVHAAPLTMSARLQNGVIHGIPVQEAATSLTTNGRDAVIDRLIVIQPNGAVLSASGAAPLAATSTQPYRLKLAAAGVSIKPLAQSFGMLDLHGLGYFQGGVQGSAGHPELVGRVSLFNAGYNRYRIDHARAQIALTPTRLSVTSGTARRLGVSMQFAGTLNGLGSRAPRIAAKVSTRGAEIAALTDVIDQMLVTTRNAPTPKTRSIAATAAGTLDADVDISGTVTNPSMTAQAHVASAVIGGVDIPQLSANATLANGVLRVPSLTGQIAGANVQASGRLNLRTKALVATAQANSSDLGHIAHVAGITQPLAGSASLSASATGTLANPLVDIDGTLSGVQYRNVPVSLAKLALTYANGVVTDGGEPNVINSGPATYTFTALRYDMRAKTIALNGTIAGEQIARLVALARNVGVPGLSAVVAKTPQGIDGALTVSTLAVSGALSGPAVHVVAAVNNLTLGQPKADLLNFTTDAIYEQGRLTLASLEGRGPDEYLSASGSIASSGPIGGRLEISNIPFSYLRLFDRGMPAIDGEINDLSLVAAGTAAKPRLTASVSLSDVSNGQISVNRIDSGRISVADNRIDIAGVSLTKTELVKGGAPIEHTAILRGTIPFIFSLQNGVTASFPADQPISLNAQLPQQSISLFSVFAPSLRSYKLAGTVEANINLGGTLRNKVITGTANLRDGAAQPAGFQTSFKNINVAVAFNGTHGTITSSQIQSTAGGFMTLGGTVDVAQANATHFANAAQALLGSVQLHMAMHAAGLTVNEPRIIALYNAGFHGAVSGDVGVNGGVLTPAVTGALRINNAIGIMPTVAASQSSEQPMPSFNPTFNLALAVAPGSRIHSPQLDAQTDGQFQIAGSLYRPDITGDLNLRSGRFNFPTAIFRIVPVGLVHFVYNPPQETTERVDITATTSISVSPTILAANPTGPTGVTSSEPYTYQPSVFGAVQNTAAQRYTITVTIQGDLGNPHGLNLDFQSNPPGLTSAQILAALGGQQALNSLLVGGNVQMALQNEAQQIFTGYALPMLLAPMEYNIAQAFGLEEFDVNYDPQSPLTISVIKQISPRLDVRYTRYVNSRQSTGAVGATLTPLQYSLAVDYNFTNRLRLNVSTDDQHNTTFGIGGVFNF